LEFFNHFVTFQLLRNFFDNHEIFSKIRKFIVIVFDRRCVPYVIVESFEMKFLFTIVLKIPKYLPMLFILFTVIY
jgi:hypothetical protein